MISAHFVLGVEDLWAPYSIREEVFVNEQGFSAQLERDDMDRRALHAVALADGEPCATGRLFYGDDNAWHIGRMAVKKEWRGKHIGDLVMRMLLDQALRAGAPEVRLGAQQHARGFYEKYGFVQSGDPYDEEGCPHIPMTAQRIRIESIFRGCGGNCADCSACAENA